MQSSGFFGEFGGIYVSELLMPALEELESAFIHWSQDTAFMDRYRQLLKDYAGRPTPLYEAHNLSQLWGARIFLKREDLLHGGAHKTNNALGQALLAKAMGKTRLIAETGAGQHGVATAMAGALLNIKTEVYMGALDMARQQPNVHRMQLLGATVHAVNNGSKTLKDAINEALRDWVSNVHETYYVMGTVAGPHPYPSLVKFFQAVIGEEAHVQIMEQTQRLPDAVLACIGGGSNAIGIFQGFLENPSSELDNLSSEKNQEIQSIQQDKESLRIPKLMPGVTLIGVEPAGHGLETNFHGAVLAKGTTGVLHGMKSLALQDQDGQVFETHSISAGLDYPLVGPEHAWLQTMGLARYESATDEEALEAFKTLAKCEGILPALESSHALAYAKRLAPELGKDAIILVNLSGRGDKDLQQVLDASSRKGDSSKQDSMLSTLQSVSAEERKLEPFQKGEKQDFKKDKFNIQEKDPSPTSTSTRNRYEERFQQLAAEGKKALIPFTILGWPNREASFDIIRTLIDNQVGALELGLAFSDPMADGVIIQEADQETLAQGFQVDDALLLLKNVREYNDQIPIGLLVYYNMVLARGIDRFFANLAEVGVDGLLIADLPAENMQEVAVAAGRHGIRLICMVSTLTSPDRLKKIHLWAEGFLYVVSRVGITGVEDRFDTHLPSFLKELKTQTDLPLCVGFGISNATQVRQMTEAGADGVVIGSRLIQLMKETPKEDRTTELNQWLQDLLAACGDSAHINVS